MDSTLREDDSTTTREVSRAFKESKMTKDEALKMALEALEDAGKDDFWRYQDKAITAIKEALAQQNQFNPDWDVMAVMVEEQQRMAKRIAELEAQPEQPKYRRGNRLVCLETDEYCVIHISGTDRQWVKFPDTHIGVYTNEQVAELFELLPKEPEPWEKFCDSNCVWTDHHPDCKLAEQEPVAWVSSEELLVMRGNALGGAKDWRINVGLVKQDGDVGLYTTPPQRTWVGLTDDEREEIALEVPMDAVLITEAKLKEKNT